MSTENKESGVIEAPAPMKLITSPRMREEEAKKPKRKPRKLIFLSGFKNTGKDTVAELLKDISIDPVEIVSFADALKSELYPKLGKEWNGNDTEDREWKESIRSEMIAYGEKQKLEHGQNYWIRRALDDLLKAEYDRAVDVPHIIVTDARRTEELMWFKHFKLGHFLELEKGFETYEPLMYVVHKDGAEADKDYMTHVALEYAAETRMFENIIRNNGSVKELENLLKDLYVTKLK